MAVKVGIPRGLFFYQYYPLWKTFFQELGAEIVVSDYTNKKILDDGSRLCIDEACLPVKVYHGHVAYLKDQVDFIFIPRFTSVSKKEYVCPKAGGLPDMIRSAFTHIPEIIDTEINLRRTRKNEIKSALHAGSYLCGDKDTIKRSYKKALKEYRHFREQVKQGKLPNEIIDDNEKASGIKFNEKSLNIAVIGHGYNLYDSYISMDMIEKLKKMGASILTVEMMDGKVVHEKAAILPKKMFWNYGTKAMGSLFCILETDNIDGVIYLMSFGCGIDAFVCDLMERYLRRNSDIPFTVLTIDEHSGEAGMNTRIEAFIDMIRWRNRDGSNLSPFGEHIHLH